MIYRMGFMSVVLLCAQLSAEDQAVRGAQQVLAELRDKSSKPKVQAKPTTPSQQLAADIKAFGEQSQDLAPNQATAKWLALFDRVLTAKNTEPDVDGELDMSALIQAQMMRQSFSFDMDMPMGMNQNSARAIIELMQVIPQPTTWDAISKGMIEQVKKQSSLSPGAADSLRVLAYMIGNDQPAATKYITALETHAEKLDSASPLLLQLASHFHDEKEEGSHLALDFEIKLEQFESRGNANPGYGNDLAVPDLVTLIGKEKAEALLRRALVLPHVEVTIQVGDQTKLLARQLAMEMIDKITRPPWKLCNSLDPIELYEALD